MKPMKDELRRAFPRPDDRFCACVQDTLRDLNAQAAAGRSDLKERKILSMKRSKFRTGVLIAAAVLVLSTVAAAAAGNKLGLFDLFGSNADKILPEATELVQTAVPQQGETVPGAPVTLALREAVCDGNGVTLAIGVSPTDPHTLLLGPDNLLSDPAGNLGLDSTETIAQYAASHGYMQFCRVSLFSESNPTLIESMTWQLESDGTLVFLNSGTCAEGSGTLPVDLACIAYPVNENDEPDEASRSETHLTFTLDRTEQNNSSVTLTNPVVFEKAGVTVHSLHLTASPMGLYYTMNCSITDKAAYAATDDFIDIYFLDEIGSSIPLAANGSSEFGFPDADGNFSITGSLRAVETVPDHMTLRARNYDTGEIYGIAEMR